MYCRYFGNSIWSWNQMPCVTERTQPSSLGRISMACYKPPVLYVHLPRHQLQVAACGMMSCAVFSSSLIGFHCKWISYSQINFFPKCLLQLLGEKPDEVQKETGREKRERSTAQQQERDTVVVQLHFIGCNKMIQLPAHWYIHMTRLFILPYFLKCNNRESRVLGLSHFD